MTEADQRDTAPEPAGKWVNAVNLKKVKPDRMLCWDVVWEEVWAEALEGPQKRLQDVEPEEVPEEARAETPGGFNSPDYI